MSGIVAQLFAVIGVDPVAPTNMQELIPYLLAVFVGTMLVVSVFRTVGTIVKSVTSIGGALS